MVRPPVKEEQLRNLTRVSPWISPLVCVGVFGAAAALAWLGGPFSGWRLAPLSFVLIAGLQHHLLTLQHEASHLLIHPNRAVNDFFGDFFCSIPFGARLKNYRLFHLTHHKYSGSPERDPEVRFYAAEGYHYRRQPAPRVLAMLLRDLCLVHYVRFAADTIAFAKEGRRRNVMSPPGVRDALLNLLFWGPLVGGALYAGFWPQLLVFWLAPQVTLTFLFLKLHGYGEHTGATGPTELERTWVHRFNPVTNFFLYPIGSALHLEHHLFPKVPWYRGQALRRLLLEDPEYARRSERVTLDGYFFGERSTLRTMLLGGGEYRVTELAASTTELGPTVVSADTGQEVDLQAKTLDGAEQV